METGLHNRQAEQKKNRKDTNEAELRYQTLVENMNQGIFHIDEAGRFILINTFFAEMLGYNSPKELLDLTPTAQKHFVSQEYYKEFLNSLERDGTVKDFEFQACCKDGTKIWLAQSARSLRDPVSGKRYIEGFSRDITEWKKAEEERLFLLARQTAILAAVPNIIMEVDENKVYTWANKSGYEFFGDDVIGKEAAFYFEGEQDTYNTIRPLFSGEQSSVYVESWQQRKDGQKRLLAWRCQALKDNAGNVTGAISSAYDITDMRLAQESLKDSKEYLNRIINCIGDPIFVKDREHKFVLVNDAMCALLGLTREEIIGEGLENTQPKEMMDSLLQQEEDIFTTGKPRISIEELHVAEEKCSIVMSNRTLLTDTKGNKQIVIVLRDITDLKKAEDERAKMESQLQHGQKLEAVGRLASGIAHEINTPTQYVGDNTRFLQEAFADLVKVSKNYNQLLQACMRGNVPPPDLVERTQASVAEADLDYIVEEIPKAISQSLEGLDRIATIVRAMKEFSHPGSDEKKKANLNHAIENTLAVCRNEWKYVAEVSLDLDLTLPLVSCFPGEINQVILNLIVNAAHAITDVQNGNGNSKGTITIRTQSDENWAVIRISDTGSGIPEQHRSKIFTPFFTTKEVGRGTGQGLAMAHSVVVAKHGGTIDFETETGKGTEFTIKLPLQLD